jgi:hypothetical protein
MDRIEDMNRVVDQDKGSPTYGQPLQGFHFDYFKVNNNMMPDVGGNKSGPVYAPEVGPKSGFTPSMSAGDWAKAWQKTLGIKRAKPQELRDHKLWVIDSLRKLAIDQGWNYGWKQDPAHTGAYPWVMYVDSPVGQISFHSRSPDTSINPEISKAAEDVSREKRAMFSQIDSRQFPDLKVSPLAAESLSAKNFQPGSTAADVREKLLEGITVQDLLWHKIDSGGVMKSVLYKLNNGWDAIPEIKNDPIVNKIRDYQHSLSSIDVRPYLLASKRFTGLNRNVVSKIYEGDWDQSKGTQLQRLEKLQEMFPTHLMP